MIRRPPPSSRTRPHRSVSSSSAATPSATTAAALNRSRTMAPLGEKEMLSWAEVTSGVHPCGRLAHLRDGLVLLGLAQCLYPEVIRRDRVTSRHRGPASAADNWAVMVSCLEGNGVPAAVLVDQQSRVETGDAGACLNALVLFYFLFRLSRAEDFTVDFTFPVDPTVAGFLQSPASLAAVGKRAATTAAAAAVSGPSPTPAVRRRHVPAAAAAAPAVGVHRRGGSGAQDWSADPWQHSAAECDWGTNDDHGGYRGPSSSSPPSSSSSASISTVPNAPQEEEEEEEGRRYRGGARGATAAAAAAAEASRDDEEFLISVLRKRREDRARAAAKMPAPAAVRQAPPRDSTTNHSRDSPAANRTYRGGAAHTSHEEGGPRYRSNSTNSHVNDSYPRHLPPPQQQQQYDLSLVPSSDVHALRVEAALLREELAHCTAAAALSRAQEQGLAEANLAQAEQRHGQAAAKARLAFTHEVKRLRLALGGRGGVYDYQNDYGNANYDDYNSGHDDDDDEELAALRDALAQSQRQHAQFAAKMRAVFASMEAATASPVDGNASTDGSGSGSGGGAPLEGTVASQYETAVVRSLVSQLAGEVRSPALADALGAGLHSLLANLRRLRARAARLQWEVDHSTEVFGGGGGGGVGTAPPATTTRDKDNDDQKVEAELRRRLAAASRTIASLQASLAESQLYTANAKEAAMMMDERQEERERAAAALELRVRLTEAKAARDARECEALYQRVSSLIAHFCSTIATEDGEEGEAGQGQAVAAGLARALEEWTASRGSMAAVEAALRRQCEAVADLRGQLQWVTSGGTSGGNHPHAHSPSHGYSHSAATIDTQSPTNHRRQQQRREEEEEEMGQWQTSLLPSSPSPSPSSSSFSRLLVSPEELERRKRAILAKYTDL